ncbi:unnamed protein product [Prorocentrum cordatum]|uniref:Calmodulin-lysine N-methyltransferase n=1 Tax=Prorocentrum cordatum TaxID=2364126 RepID=A0ABN9RJU4_9DINO|nr:unnamed protein product [Polarella glacialis]
MTVPSPEVMQAQIQEQMLQAQALAAQAQQAEQALAAQQALQAQQALAAQQALQAQQAQQALQAQQAQQAPSPDEGAEQLEDVVGRTEQLEGQQRGAAEELARLGQEVESLKSMVQKLEEEDSRQDGLIKEQGAELLRLDSAKVDVALHQKEVEAREQRLAEFAEGLKACKADTAALASQEREDPTERIGDLEKACEELRSKIQQVSEELEAGMQRAADNVDKVKTSTGEQISKNAARSEELGKEQERLAGSLQSALGTIQATKAEAASSTKEVLDQAAAIQRGFEQLEKRTEATFLQLNDRIEEMGRVERARLATLEKEGADGVARARSECRAETERLRMDYERDSSRLELDLGDLHAKYDVSKQELNFFQTRMAEQRDWAEAQIAELRTAAKAAQVDARETTTVTTKMLHALRDDAIAFREKMAGYISTLQRSTDSQGDAISTLETQRSRLRKELDGLFTDHQAYVEDMDSWANDVRLKVERLFRALEPSRVEWHIARAERKARELRRPLGLKSQGFSLKGLRQVAVEFYPEGHHTSPEGLAAVRVFMPQDAHVRYQVWIGRSSEGVREHTPGDSCSIDLLVENWKEKVAGDGSLSVVLEVLRDFRDQDQSLARDIRIESAWPGPPPAQRPAFERRLVSHAAAEVALDFGAGVRVVVRQDPGGRRVADASAPASCPTERSTRTGVVVWDAAVGLAALLAEAAPRQPPGPAPGAGPAGPGRPRLGPWRALLELGAGGHGLCGVAALLAGACQVAVLTDRQPLLAQLEENVARNLAERAPAGGGAAEPRWAVRPLLWGEPGGLEAAVAAIPRGVSSGPRARRSTCWWPRTASTTRAAPRPWRARWGRRCGVAWAPRRSPRSTAPWAATRPTSASCGGARRRAWPRRSCRRRRGRTRKESVSIYRLRRRPSEPAAPDAARP